MTFFATADIHLGRSSQVGGTQHSLSAREGWKRFVDRAIADQVDAVLLSGDLVDKENNYFEALSALEAQLKRLETAHIHTVLVAGNHDALVLPEMMNTFKNSDYVHFLGVNGQWEILKLDFKSGKTVQFLGWSFPAEHVSSNPLDLLQLSELEIQPNIPLLGLVHGDITNSDSNYAPITQASLQRETSVDAWLLGHIHLPEEFQQIRPFICYSGSLQSLSPKEHGAHGFQQIEFDDFGEMSHEFQPISPVRFEKIETDISEVSEPQELRQLILKAVENESILLLYADLSHLVLDISLTGEVAFPHEIDGWINRSDVFEYETAIDGTHITIRKITNHTRYKADNLHLLADEKSPAGVLAAAIIDLESENENPFTKKLMKSFSERTETLNNASVYMSLESNQKIEFKSSEHRQLLIDECHRLLSEMMILKQNANN